MNGEFTKSEMAALLKGLARGMHGKWERADYEALMAWATEARLSAELLELVLGGFLDPVVDEEGILRFTSTEEGRASGKASLVERLGS